MINHFLGKGFSHISQRHLGVKENTSECDQVCDSGDYTDMSQEKQLN